MLARGSSWLCLAVLLGVAFACGPEDDEDDEERGDDEVGDGDAGDGDAGDGDGEGDAGDGDGDGDDDPLEDFDALCEIGCAHFIECAPAEFGALYESPIECQATCAALYGGCVPEASAYFECFLELACADVVLAAADGPAVTACGPLYADAQAACGL